MTDTTVIDGELGDLTGLLDPAAVASELNRRWPEPDRPDTQVLTIDRHWTRLDPATRCTAVHRVRAASRGRDFVTFVVADRTRHGTTWTTARHDAQLTELGPALGDAPTAASLGDLARTSEIVPVRYRPQRRCTLLVRSEPMPVYAKLVTHGAARHRRLLAELAADPNCGLIVVPPAGMSPTDRVVLTEQVSGESVWATLCSTAHPLASRLTLAEDTGRSLAHFHHACTTVSANRTLADDLLDLRSRFRPMEVYRPETARQALALLGRVDVAATGGMVLSHGSFRFDQVLDRHSGGLAIVDLDSACRSDAESDLGNCIAYLNWRRVREPALAPDLQSIGEAFIDGYRYEGGTVSVERLVRYHALSCLKIAWRRFANLDVPEWPLVPRLLTMAAEALRRPTAVASHLPVTS